MPDHEGEDDSPPNYEEILEQDKAKQEAEKIKSGTKLVKPLKSIMKKSDKSKVARKESDTKKRESVENAVPSPRHSGESAIAAFSNGDVIDPAMISVAVVQANSQTTVDHLEMRSLGANEDHKLGAAFETDEMLDYVDDDDSMKTRPAIQPASHQRGIEPGSSSGSSNGSLNTPL